jgi:hypothetical protein
VAAVAAVRNDLSIRTASAFPVHLISVMRLPRDSADITPARCLSAMRLNRGSNVPAAQYCQNFNIGRHK